MSGKVRSRWRNFASSQGRQEYFCSFEAESGAFQDFDAELAALWSAYNAGAADRGMTPDDELLLRFHLSDAANQGPRLRKLLAGRPASITDQPPATGSRIALEAWFVAPRSRCRVVYSPRLAEGDGFTQMYGLFGKLAAEVEGPGGRLDRNVLRTWIYCRDVDNNYAGVVRGRNVCFDEHAMRDRYLASTGIGGGTDEPKQLVAMDALVCAGETPEQTPLRALDHLSPTALYGVRFERGMRVGWRDRDWFIISGTASIDREGRIMHEGDVRNQSRRVLENISALLEEGGAKLPQVCAATVYLRDPAELAQVRAEFDAAFPDVPIVYLRAPVCRPGWLVECECLATVPAARPNAPEP
jgi:enamine deaminase RidA (YjgF/YER057c/UK114 family)